MVYSSSPKMIGFQETLNLNGDVPLTPELKDLPRLTRLSLAGHPQKKREAYLHLLPEIDDNKVKLLIFFYFFIFFDAEPIANFFSFFFSNPPHFSLFFSPHQDFYFQSRHHWRENSFCLQKFSSQSKVQYLQVSRKSRKGMVRNGSIDIYLLCPQKRTSDDFGSLVQGEIINRAENHPQIFTIF